MHLTKRQERNLPYLTAAIYHAALFQLLHGLNLPFLYSVLAISGCCTLVVLFFINTKKKISAHAAACGAVTGLLFLYHFFSFSTSISVLFFVLVFIVAGLVGFARLQLKSHTSGEWYGGYVSGFFSVWISLLFYVWVF